MSKKQPVYTPEFKLAAVRRMVEGCNIVALAEELGVPRRSLYNWKAAHEAGGPEGLKPHRRGPKPKGASPPPGGGSEVEALRARVEELERLAGRQAMELDFFEAALREVGAPSRRKDGLGGTASMPSSGSGRARKAD